jgi:hypothetical protein
VYLVTDEGGGEAALKLVDTSDAGARPRLAREVAALQSLRHPSVPRVLDAEIDDTPAFVVFEYIAGPSLSERVARTGPLSPPAVASLADTLADALAAVHAAGVVHRDVTPANILLGPNGPVLIDFGLSHHRDDERLTRTGLVSGTAGYVAPEVVDGGEPTAASDDWGLAATLAFAATGKAPFGTGMGALSATLAGDVRPDVPLALARALTAAPQFRPSPRALARALAEADQTALLAVSEVGATLVAPIEEEWDDTQDEWESDDDDGVDEEDGELPERLIPHRRTVLIAWAVALVAFATVAPLIAAAVMLLAAIVARAVESATRAVWRSRDRRGVDEGGIVAQVFAGPWHLVRAAALTLPSALLAAGATYLVGALGLVLAGPATHYETWRVVAYAVAAVVAVVLLGWGPFCRPARTGAHLVAAAVTPSRGWSVGWVLLALAATVTCCGVSFAGIDALWWPIPQNAG